MSYPYELPVRLIAGLAAIGLSAAAFSLETRAAAPNSAEDVFLTPTVRLDPYSAYSFSIESVAPVQWRVSIGLLVSACLMVVHDGMWMGKWEMRHSPMLKWVPSLATFFAMFSVLRLAGIVHLDTLVALSLLSAAVVRVNEIMYHHVSALDGNSWSDFMSLCSAPAIGLSVVTLLAVEYNKVIRAVHPANAIDSIVIGSGVLFGLLAIWPPFYRMYMGDTKKPMWSATVLIPVMQVLCAAAWLAYVIQRKNGIVDNAVALEPVISAL